MNPSTLLLSSLVVLVLSSTQSAFSQGMMEMKGVSALSAGAGAGVAAAFSKAAKNSVKNIGTIMTASQADIDKYKGSGEAYEKAKNWAEAARCYQYCISNLAKKGQTQSPTGLWLLEHLSNVYIADKRPDYAIGYYKTVVAWRQKQLGDSDNSTIKGEQKLADMYVAAGDLNNAATYLNRAVSGCDNAEHKPTSHEMIPLLDSYSSVLRELGRSEEANSVDARASALRGGGDTTGTAPAAASASISAPAGTNNSSDPKTDK